MLCKKTQPKKNKNKNTHTRNTHKKKNKADQNQNKIPYKVPVEIAIVLILTVSLKLCNKDFSMHESVDLQRLSSLLNAFLAYELPNIPTTSHIKSRQNSTIKSSLAVNGYSALKNKTNSLDLIGKLINQVLVSCLN